MAVMTQHSPLGLRRETNLRVAHSMLGISMPAFGRSVATYSSMYTSAASRHSTNEGRQRGRSSDQAS